MTKPRQMRINMANVARAAIGIPLQAPVRKKKQQNYENPIMGI
jgi:hypothetical protein